MAYDIGCWEANDGGGSEGPTLNDPGGTVASAQPVLEILWTPSCDENSPQQSDVTQGFCGRFYSCPSQDETLWDLWTRATGEANAAWRFQGSECWGQDPNPELPSAPARVTWEMVLREVERVGLPSLQVQIQPAERTLVNFETNFYAVPETFERTVTLLGQRVDVRARPTQFAWDFGDGAIEETETAGMPYPDLRVTHAYSDADVTVAPSVDVTYTAEFRVSGAAWQDIPEAVTISGPPSSLRILEATPVLSGEDQDR